MNVVVGEVQLLLAEKRTSLAVMRTGIAVLALPLSVLGLLVATSKYYDLQTVLHLFLLVVLICICLIGFGGYLVVRSLRHILHQERMMQEIKERHAEIQRYMD